MNKILSINNITKIFHTPQDEIMAIDDVSLEIENGDFVALVGPSGCGKSTLLSIINKQEQATSGIINYYNKTIGYMLQDDALFEWLNVLDNCLLGLKIQNKLDNENKKYVLNLLEKYGLKDFIYSYPRNLSGGMRQRVALIRTLATKPDILLMDEPFSALDFQSRTAISNDVYKILKEENKTLIIVTHDISEAITLCNKVIVLTKRPANIKNTYNIEFNSNIKPSDRRYEETFNYYYNLIRKDIDYE